MGTSKSTFYEDIPPIGDFRKGVDEKNFNSLPDDWYVVVTDVANSTKAIEQHKYKNVNVLGISPIVAFLNIAGPFTLPFTFGGDGCTICIPKKLVSAARDILKTCRKIGVDAYDLHLRAAIIPASFIYKHNLSFKVARLKVTENYYQALFYGKGVLFSEDWLKNYTGSRYHIMEFKMVEGVEFSGLECRWNEIKYEKEKILTLLVYSDDEWTKSILVYQKVITKLQDLLGFGDGSNPVNPELLQMNILFHKLRPEINLRTSGQSWIQRLFYGVQIQFLIILGKLFMKFGYRSSETDWSRYKNDFARHSDHRKFDGMLRAVLKCHPEQKQELEKFLRTQFKNKKLVYGLYMSDAAILTCMVFNYHKAHIHFIDGQNGGYAQAAKQLKNQLDNWKSKEA